MMKIIQDIHLCQKTRFKTIIQSLFIMSLFFMITTFGLVGCGQKGMLYLPKNGETIQKPSNQHKQDDFHISENSSSETIVLEIEKAIQQRIDEMNANPNDY